MCSVVLDATPTKSISRKHAEIKCQKGGRGCDEYTLRDLVRTRMLAAATFSAFLSLACFINTYDRSYVSPRLVSTDGVVWWWCVVSFGRLLDARPSRDWTGCNLAPCLPRIASHRCCNWDLVPYQKWAFRNRAGQAEGSIDSTPV